MLPALLLALVLRIVLTVHLPYAYFHDDAPDFLTTPSHLLHEHKFELHAKKTFLVPLLFTLPFLLHVPALLAIPVGQHLLGMGLVLIVGLLCRLWFRHWRVFILPLTLLIAANPFLLWYEHTLMAETVFVFTTMLVALAGTLYAGAQTRARFVFLLIALFLQAGARPEGKLLFGFGILLVALLHWRTWRTDWPRFATIVVLAVLTHLVTKTSQAGLLLYTSVARLTPTDLKCAPGFEPYIAPIRADLQARWDIRPEFPRVRDRRAIAAAVESYLKAHPPNDGRKKRRGMDHFCLKIAKETCWRNFTDLPIHVYHKFRVMANEAPSGRFDNHWLFNMQREALISSSNRSLPIARALTGEDLRDVPALHQFIDSHYGEVVWFNRWLDGWLTTVNRWRFPDLRVPNPKYPSVKVYHYGVPYYFLAAGIGVVAVALRRNELQRFHIAWSLTLLAFFYTIILTGNVRSRFRFVFEPFWFIYVALLLECVWLTLAAPFRRAK
ncbi:MAG: hypothetical protein JWQ44_2180 [Chthoniobacter sp.]|nr:hypothetical protein [Chthoniobacter sp.]